MTSRANQPVLKGPARRLYFLALPVALIPSTAAIFLLLPRWVGKEPGYLLGFVFYWLVWCLAAPRLLIGKQGAPGLLASTRPLWEGRNWPAALLWVAVTAGAVIMYGPGFARAPRSLILLAIPLAFINGFCEEILWRGLYVRRFPHNPWLGIVYPAVGFALWHFAPQLVFPAENAAGFVISTLFLGLAYGFIAYRTGSANWTALSHSLNGILALANPLARIVLVLLEG